MAVVKISPHLPSPPWEVVLEEFLLHKQAEGRSERTLSITFRLQPRESE